MSDPVARSTSDGFRGHGCAFCGVPIPVADPDQFPLQIELGGRATRLWAHRQCLRSRVTASMQPVLDRLPPASPDDVWPRRPA